MSLDASTHTLTQTWRAFRRDHPNVVLRDAAARIGVSVGELLASDCGHGVTRLRADVLALLAALPSLGRVMVLTRNEHAVIEKQGAYADVSIQGTTGHMLGDAIELRLLVDHWHHAFAVTSAGRVGPSRSLQFVDRDGTVVHKLFLLHDSNVAAYDALVAGFRADDQGPALAVAQRLAPAMEQPDACVDGAGLRAAWNALADTRHIDRLLAPFGVTRTQALRLGAPDRVRRVASTSHRKLLAAVAAWGMAVSIQVASPGCTEIHDGPIKRVLDANGWFHVLDPDIHLHLRESGMASAFVVRLPSPDGPVTSFECHDAAGGLLMQCSSERVSDASGRSGWSKLINRLATLEA